MGGRGPLRFWTVVQAFEWTVMAVTVVGLGRLFLAGRDLANAPLPTKPASRMVVEDARAMGELIQWGSLAAIVVVILFFLVGRFWRGSRKTWTGVRIPEDLV